MVFFQPPYIKANIEKQFKDLAKLLHPDKGGTKEQMQKLTEEKEQALKLVGKEPQRKRVKMIQRNPIQKVSVVHFNLDVKEVNKFVKNFSKLFK